MKTIAIYNLKGGVGKTVTAANIGHLYATRRTHRMKGTPRNSHRRTLLIDCDPQGNLSLYFKRYNPEGPCWLSDRKIYGTDWPFLDIAPGNMDLYDCERRLYDQKDTKAFSQKDDADRDLCLIDCPPALNMLTINALGVADYLIIPVRLDAFSSQGLDELDRQLKDARAINPKLKLLGVLITHDEVTKYSGQVEAALRQNFPVFKTKISRSRWIIDSTLMQKPLAELGMNLKPAWQYRRLVNEILEEMKQ